MKQSSRARRTPFNAAEFAGGTLFDAVGLALCEAACLPRKELFESWAVAKRVHRRLGGPWRAADTGPPTGGLVYDLAAGHGLVAWLLLLLDQDLEGAVCVDKRRPESAGRVESILVARWPRLAGRVRWEEARVQDVTGIAPTALVVSAHACSTLTDLVLDQAITARARVAVLPCCQSLGRSDMGGLDAWVEGPLAVDIMRVARLKAAGYDVHLQKIPEEITPKNRLILGRPPVSPTALDSQRDCGGGATP